MTVKWKLVTLCVSFLIVFTLIFIPFQTALVFYKENTDKMEAFLPIGKGDAFQITFTHSIHLTDVVEKYHVTDDLLIEQDEIIYEEFGIGMPSNAEEGEEFVYEDGKYHVKNLNNIFLTMKIRNGKTVSENRLSWEKGNEKKKVWFNKYFEPGDWFTVKIDKISGWDYLKGVKIDG